MLGAFRIVWLERAKFLRSLALPGSLLVALFVGWWYSDMGPGWLGPLAFGLYTVIFVVFAVICHRLVLLPEAASSTTWTPAVSAREARFLGWLVVVWILAIGSVLGVVTLLVNVVPREALEALPSELGESAQLVFKAAASYMFARLCMVFPATAIDHRPSLKWSWTVTRRNGWKLVAVVGVLPWIIKQALSLLFREDATFAETLALATLAVALIGVEVAAVSLSYRELTANENG